MPTVQEETTIKLSERKASVRFANGLELEVIDNGELSIKKGSDVFGYSPSRLKKNQTGVDVVGESTFGSQKLDLTENISLNIRTEKTERLRVEIFFQEKDENGMLVSGCFFTKEATSSADWSVSFINIDRFLINLLEMF
jgi:hypothetical protein